MKQLLSYLIIVLFISGCSTITQPTAENQPSLSENRPATRHADYSPQPLSETRTVTRHVSLATHSPKPHSKGIIIPPTETVYIKRCADYESAIKQAVPAHDLEALEQLLPTLNNLPDCPLSYLDAVKRSMAQIAAVKADELVQSGQLAEAETWLRRAPTMVWGTQAVYGDITARNQKWQLAAQFYNQTLDLIADPEATPHEPSQKVIRTIYHLASETQILAGNLATVSPSGKARGIMRDHVRGVTFKKRPLPIQFNSGKTTLGAQGQEAIQRLATYLKQQNVTQLTLIGHTDSKGSHQANDKISTERAKAVKRYLQNAGVPTQIIAIGKGKREPLQLANRLLYTPQEIDALNRRVEFVLGTVTN